MFQMEKKMCKVTKNVQGNKKCAQVENNVPFSQNEVHRDPMGAKYYLLWYIMVLICRVWPYMAACGHIWPCMAL